MPEFWHLLLSLVLGGATFTAFGLGVVWSLDETRRIRRGVRRVLGDTPHSLLIAQGRGRAVACNFTSNQMAVCWDAAAWCLVFRLDELVGAELIVDGRVEARVHRGENRRALDRMSGGDQQVRLRLLFNDPRHPDFSLDLWLPEDAERRRGGSPVEAIQEANRWLALVEALLRRPPRHSTVSHPPRQDALPFEAREDHGDDKLTA